eukprot:jgi/Bigna1/127821/aug1.5_g2529
MYSRDSKLLPIPKNVPSWGSPLFPAMPNGPVIDGSKNGLLGVPIELIESGNFNKVPIMYGANRDGGNIVLQSLSVLAVPGATFPADNATLGKVAAWMLQNETKQEEIFALYPYSEYANTTMGLINNDRVAYALRDLVFQCPNRRLGRAWARQHKLDTFLYVFSFDLGTLDKSIGAGDFHISELPFVFKTWDLPVKALGVKDAQQISNSMSCRWARFLYCKHPNKECDQSDEAKALTGCDNKGTNEAYGLDVHWPKFDEGGDGSPDIFFSLKAQMESVSVRDDNRFPDYEFPSNRVCDFWDSIDRLPWHNLRKHDQKPDSGRQ